MLLMNTNSMNEKLVYILNEMAEYLSVTQMKKLQEVLLKHLSNGKEPAAPATNAEYLRQFLNAKRIEGCSERTLQYYRVTGAAENASDKRINGAYPYYGASGIVDYVDGYIFNMSRFCFP